MKRSSNRILTTHCGSLARPKDLLPKILDRCCWLPVKAAEDGEALREGVVYIGPADHHLSVLDYRLEFSDGRRIKHLLSSADPLFESVADAFGAHAIAVVLTGASEDGASGAAAIHDAGGSVLVEDPTTAESRTLPGAVLSRFEPDAIVPLPEIANTLMRWCRPNSSEAVISRRT